MPNRMMLCIAALLIICASSDMNAQPQRSVVPRPSPTPVPAASTQPAPQPSPQTASQVSAKDADLAITANVTARTLRFDAVPNVTVEFPGRPRRETAWEAERTNLPRPVQPGVTYRDIGVRLKIVSVFADIDRIVAEALGEVPPSDDQAQPDASLPDSTSPASDAAAGERTAVTNDVAARDGETARRDEVTPLPGDSSRAAGNMADRESRVSASRRARTQSVRRQR